MRLERRKNSGGARICVCMRDCTLKTGHPQGLFGLTSGRPLPGVTRTVGKAFHSGPRPAEALNRSTRIELSSTPGGVALSSAVSQCGACKGCRRHPRGGRHFFVDLSVTTRESQQSHVVIINVAIVIGRLLMSTTRLHDG